MHTDKPAYNTIGDDASRVRAIRAVANGYDRHCQQNRLLPLLLGLALQVRFSLTT
jgi:hypothetical protein